MDWRRAEELSESGMNAREVADELGLDYETTRNHLKKWRKRQGRPRENHGQKTGKTGTATIETRDLFRKSKYTYERGLSIYEDEQQVVAGRAYPSLQLCHALER